MWPCFLPRHSARRHFHWDASRARNLKVCETRNPLFHRIRNQECRPPLVTSCRPKLKLVNSHLNHIYKIMISVRCMIWTPKSMFLWVRRRYVLQKAVRNHSCHVHKGHKGDNATRSKPLESFDLLERKPKVKHPHTDLAFQDP